MGKVVRVVGAVVISIGAAALAAPTGGLSLVAAFHISAIAALAIGTVAGVVGIALLNAVLPAPSARVGGYAPLPPPTRALQKTMTGMCMKEEPFSLSRLTVPPVRERWWRDSEWPWQRLCLWRTFGDCMRPIYSGEHWIVVDRKAPLDAGDLITFNVDDLDQYLRAASLPLDATGLTKRFLGVDDEAGDAIVECLCPPMRIRVPLARILWAHRIMALAPTKREARTIMRAARG